MQFEIVEFEDLSGPVAHIYSLLPQGSGRTLLEEFFDENKAYSDELREIYEKIDTMAKYTGCRRDFFKHNEGAAGDGVAALRVGQIRLYCLYYDRTAVIFGSGGYKTPHTRAYQETPALNAKAELVKKIAKAFNKALIDKDIKVEEDGSISGLKLISYD